MYLLGFSLDNLSLDGADHLHRLRGGRRHRHDREHRPPRGGRRQRRWRRRCAARRRSASPSSRLTVSLIAVLIPLLFMGDVVGRLFREFAVTLAVTIVLSAVVSLTLVPMLCALLVQATARPTSATGWTSRPSAASTGSSRATGAGSAGCWTTQALTLLGGAADLRRHGGDVRRHPQGVLPRAGHRHHPGHLGSGAGHFLCRHGRAPAATGRRRARRPGGGQPVLVHRRGRHQHHAQRRADADQPEAEGRARAGRDGGDRAAAGGGARGARHRPVHAAGAGPDCRFHRQPGAVPLLPGEPRRQPVRRLGAQAG